MKKTLSFRVVLGALTLSIFAICNLASAAPFAQEDRDPIDLVIVLDTSGTMRGLIDSARIGLWDIVNDLAIAEPTPRLRVGLVSYGNQAGSPANGWVRVEVDLTDDLDLFSERLFALESRGANEYVGRALETALEKLSWSSSDRALRFLFLAGNEPPDQDPTVRYQDMSELARQHGIVFSAVFCGPEASPEAAGWKDMATLAEGHFASINHNLAAAVTATPLDSQLIELGDLMNETFVPYGQEGKARSKTRSREDKNARKQGAAVAAARAMTKASPVYSIAGDLVEAYEQGIVDVTAENKDLPRSLRAMAPEQRVAFLEDMSRIRSELRERIAEIGMERRRIASENTAAHDPRTFDRVLRSTIRERAREAGFHFPEE